jgi:hypothetical protein
VATVTILAVSRRLPLHDAPQAGRASRNGKVPLRFVLFAASATLYGVAETKNGNWAQLDMTDHVGPSTTAASIALTAWAMATVGRIVPALVARRVAPAWTYRTLPFLLAAALVFIAVVPHGALGAAILAFGLAGLGCSALLPLTISFGQQQLVAIEASASGAIIAFYQVGYGIAAFGVGPLTKAGINLPTIFGGTSVIAAVMGGLAFAIVGGPRTTRRHGDGPAAAGSHAEA